MYLGFHGIYYSEQFIALTSVLTLVFVFQKNHYILTIDSLMILDYYYNLIMIVILYNSNLNIILLQNNDCIKN